MTTRPQRTDPLSSMSDPLEPLELTADQIAPLPPIEPIAFDEPSPEPSGHGGRRVLAGALTILAVLWLAYTAWAAGRSLSGQPLTSPQFAQWISVAAGPLALFGLAWLTFGRTRRKESERFTRSVVAMRHEAQSLEALLEVLSQRILDSRAELSATTRQLMQLGDDATARFGGITREFDGSAEKLKRHGEALDRAALNARTDLAVVLDDLPRAEQSARQLAEEIRSVGSESHERTRLLGERVGELTQRTREADILIGEAIDRLSARLGEIERAGGEVAQRIGEADSGFNTLIDSLLERTSASLGEIRSGIDAQAAAVAALVAQASAGIGKAGADSAEALSGHVDHAHGSLEQLSARVAEQERASQRMIAEIDRGLSLIDERFAKLASQGDVRANSFLQSLSRARAELDSLAAQSGSQDSALGSLAERIEALRSNIDRLNNEIREGAGAAMGELQGGAERLAEATGTLQPRVQAMRDAIFEASGKLELSGDQVSENERRIAALLTAVGAHVDGTQARLAELSLAVGRVESEAAALTAHSAPALVSALVQVKETAGQAAQRAREAIAAVIPESADKLSRETRETLERVIRDSIEERLREVEQTAARAVDSARAASDRLTQQMLTLGQTAAALEAHIEQTGKDEREKESEAFARRVALLIDSMNSAAIDVGKILSDEIDDKAWGAYLKGNRGVFTSRAVRLIGGTESRALRAHYDTDIEFQRSVNRYIHDFEEMLRRVLSERDGGMLGVTLLSSDMGKLYAALNQAIEKRR